MNRVLLVLLLLLGSQAGMSQGNRAMDSLGLEVKALEDTLSTTKNEYRALGGKVVLVDEKVTRYYDMFKHQWTVFGVLLTALSLVIVVMIPLAGLISFRSFRKEIAENTVVFNERLTSIEAGVEESQEVSNGKIVDLLEKLAYTNRIIYFAEKEDSPYRFRAAYMSLEYYILCYRLKKTPYYDAKIRESSGFLVNIYSNVASHPHTRPDLYFQANKSFNFDFMEDTGDLLPETYQKLLCLRRGLMKTIDEGITAINSRPSL